MGAQRVPEYSKIVVSFEFRDDGGLRAWSDDVPGFVLSHNDPTLVIADVEPALAAILSAQIGRHVTVHELQEGGWVAQHVTRPTQPEPTLRRREYVSALEAA